MTRDINWPELPTSGYICGRSATTEDVDSGVAVFALKSGDDYVGEPVDVDVPQYAIHVNQDTSERTPVVVTQVEKSGEVTFVGCLSVVDGSAMAGLMHEFQLLGTDVPA